MTHIRHAFLDAAGSAATLVRDPAVVRAWSDRSALTGFTVGGLATHLVSQLVYPAKVLAEPEPDFAAVDLMTHYGRSAWLAADIDNEANTGIRVRNEAAAGAGPDAVASDARAMYESLTKLVPAAPAGRRVAVTNGPWSLTVEDLLVTRLMEIAVHSDDLAFSVGIPTPELPAAVVEPVIDLLARLAIKRHGTIAVLRALSRAERSPATISAL